MAEPASAPAGQMCVTVVASVRPGSAVEWTGFLPQGATVADALAASGLADTAPELFVPVPLCGVWGRVVDPAQVLRDQDRVELYRPLTVDPKVARRERFARQGARTTGLFARQRPGGKSGY
ncbi:RnfH family protein [Rhodococcus sp. SRB_17]|uniref:RnfH family protein n=1 Tax=Acidovorax sp. SRB_24 TaxID=1962700 RepID=UPI00145C5D01|nr:RnfH family protein [Acidovorax sp. SRB_24]NMM85769.1 RnfH family protein [Rhodococcus sp. SRB_17]